jgi:SAM-dependent methyltransferase
MHEFWRNPNASNRPERYLEPIERSRLLLAVVEPDLRPDWTILEIGCNVGRNLEFFRAAGAQQLTGIEINGEALALLRESYPELGSMATLINAPIEDVIGSMAARSFDLVYTMAVLEHIHPDSEWVFGEMARITRSLLVTVEDEHGVSVRHTPRNYRQVFEGLGMRQILERRLSGAESLSAGFVARVFKPAEEPAGAVG